MRGSRPCLSIMWQMPSVLTSLPAVTDAMEEREEEAVFCIWVNWERRVISFSEENEFEELRFPTHEEKFKFAIDRGNEGFGI